MRAAGVVPVGLPAALALLLLVCVIYHHSAHLPVKCLRLAPSKEAAQRATLEAGGSSSREAIQLAAKAAQGWPLESAGSSSTGSTAGRSPSAPVRANLEWAANVTSIVIKKMTSDIRSTAGQVEAPARSEPPVSSASLLSLAGGSSGRRRYSPGRGCLKDRVANDDDNNNSGDDHHDDKENNNKSTANSCDSSPGGNKFDELKGLDKGARRVGAREGRDQDQPAASVTGDDEMYGPEEGEAGEEDEEDEEERDGDGDGDEEVSAGAEAETPARPPSNAAASDREDDYNDYGAYVLSYEPADQNRSASPGPSAASGFPLAPELPASGQRANNSAERKFKVIFFAALSKVGKQRAEQVVVNNSPSAPNGSSLANHYSPLSDALNSSESSLMLYNVVEDDEAPDEDNLDDNTRAREYGGDIYEDFSGLPEAEFERAFSASSFGWQASNETDETLAGRVYAKYSQAGELSLDLRGPQEGELGAGGSGEEQLDEEDARWLSKMDERSGGSRATASELSGQQAGLAARSLDAPAEDPPPVQGGSGGSAPGRALGTAMRSRPLNQIDNNDNTRSSLTEFPKEEQQQQQQGQQHRHNNGQPGPSWETSGEMNNNEESHNIYYWRLVWAVLPLGATFGNLLVILAVYNERSLQSVTNYFIVSLAFADLFVGIVVMPFAVYVLVNEVWELSDAICDIYIATDVTSSTASILNLVAISIDRYRAVAHPIAYSARSSGRRAIFTILMVWLISCCVGAPIILGLNTSPERKSTICVLYNSTFIFWSSLTSFYVPCIIMIGLYWRIFLAIRSRTKKTIGSTSSAGANHLAKSQQAALGGLACAKQKHANNLQPTASEQNRCHSPAGLLVPASKTSAGASDERPTSATSTSGHLKATRLQTSSPSSGGQTNLPPAPEADSPRRLSSSCEASPDSLARAQARAGQRASSGSDALTRKQLLEAEALAGSLLSSLEDEAVESLSSARRKLKLALQSVEQPSGERRPEKFAQVLSRLLERPSPESEVDLATESFSMCLLVGGLLGQLGSSPQLEGRFSEVSIASQDGRGCSLESDCEPAKLAGVRSENSQPTADLVSRLARLRKSNRIVEVINSKCNRATSEPSKAPAATCCACCGLDASQEKTPHQAEAKLEPEAQLWGLCLVDPIAIGPTEAADKSRKTAFRVRLLEVDSSEGAQMLELNGSIGDLGQRKLLELSQPVLLWLRRTGPEVSTLRRLPEDRELCAACASSCLLFSALPVDKQAKLEDQPPSASEPAAKKSAGSLSVRGVLQSDCSHLSKLLKEEKETRRSNMNLNLENGSGSESGSDEEEESLESSESSSLSTGFKFNMGESAASGKRLAPGAHNCHLSASGGELSYNSTSDNYDECSHRSSRHSCCQNSPSAVNGSTCPTCERLLLATTSCSLIPAISSSKNIGEFFGPGSASKRLAAGTNERQSATEERACNMRRCSNCLHSTNSDQSWTLTNNMTAANNNLNTSQCECSNATDECCQRKASGEPSKTTPTTEQEPSSRQFESGAAEGELVRGEPASRQRATSGGVIESARQKMRAGSMGLGKLIGAGGRSKKSLESPLKGERTGSRLEPAAVSSSGTTTSSSSESRGGRRAGGLASSTARQPALSANQPEETLQTSSRRNNLVSPYSSELNSNLQPKASETQLQSSSNAELHSAPNSTFVDNLLGYLLLRGRKSAGRRAHHLAGAREAGQRDKSPPGGQQQHKHRKPGAPAIVGGSLARHRGGSRRRREKNAARRERKATKTLAIVLGIFLICWTPFFTCNIIDGFCIQLEMDCRPGMMVYLVTSWLGYINSCVNPIIYTIFNMEFRRAFKKILTSGSCCSK